MYVILFYIEVAFFLSFSFQVRSRGCPLRFQPAAVQSSSMLLNRNFKPNSSSLVFKGRFCPIMFLSGVTGQLNNLPESSFSQILSCLAGVLSLFTVTG